MENERLKIKKEISLGDIIAALSALSGVIFAYTTLDKRLTVVEVNQNSQVARDKQQDEWLVNARDSIKSQLTKLDDKLDWLIKRTVEVKK